MGFGLCLLAANYPDSSFVGIDFLPDHIAHARWLAKELDLANICFLDDDFLDLSSAISERGVAETLGFSSFNYVVAHGVATWVPKQVQTALFATASRALEPGGIFYCSYNTYPGWLTGSPLHQLSQEIYQTSMPSNMLAAINQASGILDSILSDEASPLRHSLPNLSAQAESCRDRSSAYLLGEYGSQSWQPLYVGEMHRRCAAHKLTYCGSANLPENFLSFLDPERHAIINKEENPQLRLTLLDLLTNQSFRRDLFMKGRREMGEGQRIRALSAVCLARFETQPVDRYSYATTLGTIEASPSFGSGIDSALQDEPASLAEIAFSMGVEINTLLPAMVLLLQGGRIELASQPSSDQIAHIQAVNRRLIGLIQDGHHYTHLAAPSTGSALPISSLEALIIDAYGQGLDQDIIPAFLQMWLSSIGGELKDASGKVILDPGSQLEALTRMIPAFLDTRLPMLERLGIIPTNSPQQG